MKKIDLEYIMPQCQEKYPDDARKIVVSDQIDSNMAEDVAENFHNNCDGREHHWPVDFELFREGESIGIFRVNREAVPQFYTEQRVEPEETN